MRNAPGTFGKAPLASRYLNPRLRDGPRRRVTETATGARFAVDTQDLIQRYLYLFGTWEPRMKQWLRHRLAPGDTFIDVGANIGYFSVLASQLVGAQGKVVAIEAFPLPDVLEDDEIANACVIKVDVEGAEGSVVRGMAPLLDKLRSDAEVTVEVTPERMTQLGDSVEELLVTMRSADFHVYRLANEYAPATYPSALRGAAAVPVRWRGPVTGESDLIFSRIDAETLPWSP